MRIIITGATGFIGSNLARIFLQKGCEVVALVREKSPHLQALPSDPGLRVIPCRLAEPETWKQKAGAADAFLHLAWGGVNRAEIDSPAVQEANIAMSLACVRAAHELGCRVFMDAGSRVEYGRVQGLMQEDLPCEPINEYGRAKLEFYRQAAPLCEALGLRYCHLRFFSVYGIGDHPWSIISTLVRELPQGKTVSLSACRHRWNFMYIDDAAEAVYRLYLSVRDGRTPAVSIVNIAGRDTRELRSFVEEIHRLAGGRGQLEYGSFVQAREGALSVCPDVERLEQFTGGFRERYSFGRAIGRMLEEEGNL